VSGVNTAVAGGWRGEAGYLDATGAAIAAHHCPLLALQLVRECANPELATVPVVLDS